MILMVYTGEGKGKTSATVGQAMRALGQGLKVAFAQFMKSDVRAGEQRMLERELGADFFMGGCGFYRNEAEKARHRAAALEVLDWAGARASRLDMLLLDEALYALGAGLLEDEELKVLIALCRKENTHLVLSGRGLPGWLLAEADTVTELVPRKHHYAAGIKAQKGIEF